MAVGSLLCAAGRGWGGRTPWGVSRKRLSDSKYNQHTQHSQALCLQHSSHATIALLHSLGCLPTRPESSLHSNRESEELLDIDTEGNKLTSVHQEGCWEARGEDVFLGGSCLCPENTTSNLGVDTPSHASPPPSLQYSRVEHFCT